MGRSRRRRRLASAALAAALLGASAHADAAAAAPRVAIVMCEESYAADWFFVQGSAQGLVGLAGLVGVRYETLSLKELIASATERYTSIWFAHCLWVNPENVTPLALRLEKHVAAAGSVFIDAPLGIAYRTGTTEGSRSMNETFPYLGITEGAWVPLHGATVRTTSAAHPAAARGRLPPLTTLTQGFGDAGLDTFVFDDDGAPDRAVLLEMVPSAGGAPVPYLVAAKANGGANVLAAGSYASGLATPFRNESPSGFYDNRLLPYFLTALEWMLGEEGKPFVGLQLSHAPMTAIARLDGDLSEDALTTRRTLDYLVDLGKRTGVAAAYGIVSGRADEGATWSEFAKGAPGIQELGGTIGTHSRSHLDDMSGTLAPAGWAPEVAGSLQTLHTRLDAPNFKPDAYAFINPGNPIQNADYGRFFGAIELYMTHAWESTTPYSTGVMGFGLPAGVPRRPVVNNTPMADYEWLFSEDWHYTVAAATDLQKRILGWFQQRVGRGALYDEMWHDYLIGQYDVPLYDPNKSALPLFDAHVEHFEQNRIYAPSIRELIGKLYLAQGAAVSSTWGSESLTVTVDTSEIAADHGADAAGMGLRVGGATQPIASVTLAGKPHHAFTEDTVILPAGDRRSTFVITFGAPPDDPRLTYISKAPTTIAREGDRLDVTLRRPGLMTKLCFGGARGTVLLHADSYRREGEELCGELRYGSPAAVVSALRVDTGASELHVTSSDRPILSAQWKDDTLTLSLGPGDSGAVTFESKAEPASVTVDRQPSPTPTAGTFSVTVERSQSTVTVRMPSLGSVGPGAGDGGLGAGDGGPPVVPPPDGGASAAEVFELTTSGCTCSLPARRDVPAPSPWLAGIIALALRRRRCDRADRARSSRSGRSIRAQ